MKDNTSRQRASIRGGWEPMPSDVWRDVAELLPLPWTAGQAAHDLRVYAADVKLNRRRKMPGRPALAARWGWTDYRVRTLLKSEDEWMLRQVSPAHRQPTASAPTVSVPTSQVEPSPTASPSPARRQPNATRAEVQTSDNRLQTKPPVSPPAGDADKAVDSVDKSKPVKRKRSTALTLEQIAAVEIPAVLKSLPGWSEAWAMYAEHRQELKSGKWQTPAQVGRMVTKLLKANADGLDVVFALVDSAANGYRGVFPKLPTGAATATPQGTGGPALTPDTIWQAMMSCMGRVGARRLPTAVDAPELDEVTFKRAMVALGGAARWSALCRTKPDDLHFRVRPAFVRSFRREVA